MTNSHRHNDIPHGIDIAKTQPLVHFGAPSRYVASHQVPPSDDVIFATQSIPTKG
jgi:hypothetical protein